MAFATTKLLGCGVPAPPEKFVKTEAMTQRGLAAHKTFGFEEDLEDDRQCESMEDYIARRLKVRGLSPRGDDNEGFARARR